ncbi:MAG: alpha/beta fold hydrolase [Clostridia bacterium]|nr:alpha/beta fold hydrolase [Clostridia bacterium]
MKKLLSLLLVTLLLFSVMVPISSAYVDYEKVPIIFIRGNGHELFKEDGTQIWPRPSIDLDKDKIVETAVNIILPLLLEGIPFDKWDNYTMAIYNEISPLFDNENLDGNGLPKYGTGLKKEELEAAEIRRHENTGADGWFDLTDYTFPYDWRLSPIEYVDELHLYILDIMEATGSDKICLVGRCMGSGLVMAYLEKYGHLGHIKNVVFDSVVANGCEEISELFSGQVDINEAALQRYVADSEQLSIVDAGNTIALSEMMNDILGTTIDLFNQTGVTNVFSGLLEDLYDELYRAVLPPIALSVIATQANYWTGVKTEDFDAAVSLIFGEEGDYFYEEFRGLIEKLRWYDDTVASRLPELYDIWEYEYGIHIGVIAKYGHQMIPVIPSANEPSDTLINIKDAAFGVTAADVGTTLSDKYINSRIEADFGQYISPDKQIDVSTGRFPETTWIIKNSHHNYYDLCDYIATDFCRSTNQTVDSANTTPQFMMFDEYTRTWSEMTEDNCADLPFVDIVEEKPSIFSRIIAFIKWLAAILVMLFNGNTATV